MSERGYKVRFLQAFADEQIVNLGQTPQPPEITDQDDLRDASKDEPSGHGSKLTRSNVTPNHHHIFDSGSRNRRGRSGTDSTLRFPVIETRMFPKDDSFKGREKDLANLASETFNQIAMSLASAASGTDQETLTRLGREFLKSTKARWLMILDNVDKWYHAESFVPMKTSVTMGSILITTRHQGLTAPSRPIDYYRQNLEELTNSEGRDLLLHGSALRKDAAVARSKFHLSIILTAQNGGKPPEEAQALARESRDVLSRLLVYDDIQGVREEDASALFDHLQPVFGGRWTETRLLKYVP
ncbi:hypothetical protein CGCFRS4_v009215 [Colletotrichum fructicola]|nr:hypothetical protein CGCFRS4_v009215 [Colletotrichum fructicola]KAF4931435.1 hypothetical protein CGCF245_v011176 [Colletotrichum fructicola]